MKIVHAHTQREVNASNFSSGHVLCNKLSLRENSMMRRKLIGCVWSFVGIDPRADRRDCCEVFGLHHSNLVFGWQHLMDYRDPQESQAIFETRTLQTQCRWKVIAYGAKLKGFSTVFARYAVCVRICRPSRRYGQISPCEMRTPCLRAKMIQK